PNQMIPAIRNILGGFLFSGDDVYKKAGVLSGGERTRLAVARMLLRPSNTLLLDEPTNHLDLDSKEVLLDALADYGGTLIFVSHDRYFVERLATKIVEVGGGHAVVYPGTYEAYLWSKEQRAAGRPAEPPPAAAPPPAGRRPAAAPAPTPAPARSYEDRKRDQAEQRKRDKAARALQARIADLERRIAEREERVRTLEATMSAPGFYDDHLQSKPVIDEHQGLMWEVGDLLGQWEMLQAKADGGGDDGESPDSSG
ncbi:MAG: ATP-binding cassette domain-containing protein, partial [Vicinamibacterales bacterium]